MDANEARMLTRYNAWANNEVIAAVRALLAAESRRTPMALLVEDLHWADTESVSVVRKIAESISAHRVLLLVAPLGFLALEAGWIVTEVGRQPWVIHGVMRTADGVTPRADVPVTLFGFAVLYLLLGSALVVLLRGLAVSRRATQENAHVA